MRGTTQSTPISWTTDAEYPWTLATGYHDFEMQVQIDYTGTNSLVRIFMDGSLKHTVTHENSIITSGNSVPGGLFTAFGSYSCSTCRELEVLYHYLTVE